jgi:hypothetical protein
MVRFSHADAAWRHRNDQRYTHLHVMDMTSTRFADAQRRAARLAGARPIARHARSAIAYPIALRRLIAQSP